jgi:large subunit ribosomal protein L28
LFATLVKYLSVFDREGAGLMAKCETCGKSITFGKKYSHSHIRTNRQWKPNVQRVKVKVNGSSKEYMFAAAACDQAKFKGPCNPEP